MRERKGHSLSKEEGRWWKWRLIEIPKDRGKWKTNSDMEAGRIPDVVAG